MTDEEILALANTVSEKMRALVAARAQFQGESDIYTAKYEEWDTQRGIVTAAERELAAAKAALEDALATR